MIAGLAIAALLIAPAKASADVAVLMYHRFGEAAYPSTNVRLEAFEAQLAQIDDLGLEAIPLENLVAALQGEAAWPDRAVSLTIDDAYASVYHEAWPRLRAAGVPVTVFVATDPVDAGHGDYLSWDQLRELAAEGVTLANHGASHASLPRRPGERREAHLARVRADLLRGARRLREELGASPRLLESVFAYPFGEYDSSVAEVVASLGWVAFGQHSGAVGRRSDPIALPRYPVNEAYSDPVALRDKLLSRSLPVERVEPWDPVSPPDPVLDVWLWPGVVPGVVPGLAPEDARSGEGMVELSRLACFVSGQGAVSIEWVEPFVHFRVAPPQALPVGRSRVNCTAPSSDGRFAWFSHPWLVRSE